MKKFWIGVILLAFLLTAGLLNAWRMDRNYRKIASLLTEAADMALSGEIAQGADKAETAQDLWERYRNAVATVADHGPLENVESLFSQLKTYASEENPMEFAACCRATSRQVEAVGEAQTLNWQNLL